MAKIAWTNEALHWLEDIFEYIAADNPDAAARTVEAIFERAQLLAQFPEMGHRFLQSARNVRFSSIATIESHICSRMMETWTSLAYFTALSTSRSTSSK
ncbi:MAG TPA: type II toxin-antitoxin system RelE/ParE family toxin [Usitatibacter sp.]|nr:type II toxin-antitoxin system RelE/ParE family toxin [Usitatibacter sp.]